MLRLCLRFLSTSRRSKYEHKPQSYKLSLHSFCYLIYITNIQQNLVRLPCNWNSSIKHSNVQIQNAEYTSLINNINTAHATSFCLPKFQLFPSWSLSEWQEPGRRMSSLDQGLCTGQALWRRQSQWLRPWQGPQPNSTHTHTLTSTHTCYTNTAAQIVWNDGDSSEVVDSSQ